VIFRTLIADDEVVARRHLAALLRREPDVEIIGEAPNGIEALRLLDELDVDLLLIDVQMPGLDGFQVLRRMRAHPLVVFTTAHDEYALEAFRANAVEYLLKPLAPEEVKRAMQKVRQLAYARLQSEGVSPFFDWIKTRSHQFRGVTFGTMLRDEAYDFMRLGTFMERADNTARLLDVKYHTLLPSVGEVGGAVDYYQWGALLRSLSAFDSYRKIYRDAITPTRVAELLVLRDDVPRSLHSCMNEIYAILQRIATPESREPERLAGEVHAQLHYGRTEEIVKLGLHEYLMTFLEKVGTLTEEINRHFLVPSYGIPVARRAARPAA